MADLKEAFIKMCATFKIESLNQYQKKVITEFVNGKKDIFVSLPTGFGKSIIYQALPLIFDCLTGSPGHVVVVISPLINLMKDQVRYLRSVGVQAVSLSDLEDDEAGRVEKCNYSVVFGTPESWLRNEHWRQMLGSKEYLSKLCGVAVDEAHIIRQWGTSTNNKMTAFRTAYAQLHELKTLAPVKLIALTATATGVTESTIFDILRMYDPVKFVESPDKPNITYAVEYISNDADLQDYFAWLVDNLKKQGKQCNRTIIYCQTIKQCSVVYATLKSMLGPNMHTSNCSGDKSLAMLEMLHSCTPNDNKEAVLRSFHDENGEIRILVATITFGMGVDCKGVRTTLHFGPSKNVEAFIQECGRAGRDGKHCYSYIIYKGLMLNHVEKDIKEYVKTRECRRRTLMKHFSTSQCDNNQGPLHLCCDNCAAQCECGMSECHGFTRYPRVNVLDDSQSSLKSKQKRTVDDYHREQLSSSLVKYHKTLVMELIGRTAKGELKSLTNLNVLLGFSELQVEQVINNCDSLFSLDDICDNVEIWNMKHAHMILNMINQVFGDVSTSSVVSQSSCTSLDSDSDNDELDDMLLGEWTALIEDEDLLNMIADNLSLSAFESSLEVSNNQSLESTTVSPAALKVLQELELD